MEFRLHRHYLEKKGGSMRILLISDNSLLKEKLLAYQNQSRVEVGFANSEIESIPILENYEFEMIFIEIKSYTDIDMIRNIEKNYDKSKVYLIINRKMKKINKILRENDYNIIDQSFNQGRLSSVIN